jgi:hypothetical protein
VTSELHEKSVTDIFVLHHRQCFSDEDTDIDGGKENKLSKIVRDMSKEKRRACVLRLGVDIYYTLGYSYCAFK